MKRYASIAGAVAVFLLFAAAGIAAQEAGLEELFKNMPRSTAVPRDSGPEAPSSADQPENAGGEATATEGGPPRGDGTVAGGTALAGPSWSLRGEQTSIYRLPLFRDPPDYDGVYLKPSVENLFRLESGDGPLRLVSAWRVDLWPLGAPIVGGATVLTAGGAQITTTPEDNYLEARSEKLRFTVGYFVDHWGTADGINPTNNVNPSDYVGSLAVEAIPSLLLRLVYFPIPALSLEGVFEPYKRDDLFPVDPAASIAPQLFAPTAITESQPPVELSSSVFGFKASLYSFAVDLSVSYLYDIDPYFTPRITYVNFSDKSLELVRTRIHRIGADAKGSIGPFGLWLETCLSLTEDLSMTNPEIRNPFLSWTVGTDVNWGPGEAYYLNLQYTGRYIFGYDRSYFSDYPEGVANPSLLATDPSYATTYLARTLSDPLADQTEGLLSGLILKSDFPITHGRWNPGLTAAFYLPFLYDTTQQTRYGSLLLEPRLEFSPTSSVTLSVGGQLLFAWKRSSGSNRIELDTADRIGRWHDQSNLSLQLDLTW